MITIAALLATAGKILSTIISNRLYVAIANKFLPESQCGFRSGRSTVDMILSARKLQEKCHEQQCDLYLVFIDLTKAFNSVSRQGLCTVLSKLSCPSKLTNIIRCHDGMYAFHSNSLNIDVQYRFDGGVFNLCRLAAKSKTAELLIRDLLYADDCAFCYETMLRFIFLLYNICVIL